MFLNLIMFNSCWFQGLCAKLTLNNCSIWMTNFHFYWSCLRPQEFQYKLPSFRFHVCTKIIFWLFTSPRCRSKLHVKNLYCLALEALQHQGLLFKLGWLCNDINYFSIKGNTQQVMNMGPGSTDGLRSQLSFDPAMLEVKNY